MKKQLFVIIILLLFSSFASAQSVPVSEFKPVLINSIVDYLTKPTPRLEKDEVKDLIVVYLTSSDIIDLSKTGKFSGKKIGDILNKFRGACDECVKSARICSGSNAYQECVVIDYSGYSCTKWKTYTCPSGQICSGGKCISSNVYVCDAIKPLANTQNDASTLIQKCIDDAPANSIVELPAGKYYVKNQVRIDKKPITLRTQGKTENMPKCSLDDSSCAELIASDDIFFDTKYTGFQGFLQITQNGAVVDHIILNGNKEARRGKGCPPDGRGHNSMMMCDNCDFTNSVVKNSICAAGICVGAYRRNIKFSNNIVSSNGVHNLNALWSDGLTVHMCDNCIFTNNEIIDNTDVDFIFGGCTNCIVKNNKILHTEDFSKSSFVAMIIQAWPSTTGNFTNSIFSDNFIDCGPSKMCGHGLYIGPDISMYYSKPDMNVYGGSVHDNTVRNAQQGIFIDAAHDMEVYNNKVELSGTESKTSCGVKKTSDYNMGTRAYNIDTSKDNPPVTYTRFNWEGCVPNWWQPLATENKNVKTSFTELNKQISGCTLDNIKTNLCYTATHRYCQLNGGYSTGFGPVEYTGDDALVTCLSIEFGRAIRTTFTELQKYVALCKSSNVIKGCIAAAKRFCAAKGYESGFGPVEHSGDIAYISCVSADASKNLETSFNELSTYQSGCTLSNPVSKECNVAIKKYCEAKGYISGFGPVEYTSEGAWVTCVS